MNGALRPPVVVDDHFDRAVEQDLDGKADAQAIDLLEADPLAWRACLAARVGFIQAVLGGAVETTWHEVLVEQKGSAMSSFRVRVRGLERGRLLGLLATIEARLQRCKVLQREITANDSARNAAAKRSQISARMHAPGDPCPTRDAVAALPHKARMAQRVIVLEDLLYRALYGVAPSDPIHAEAAAYCDAFRRGFMLNDHGDSDNTLPEAP